jgi:hypothetical protein
MFGTHVAYGRVTSALHAEGTLDMDQWLKTEVSERIRRPIATLNYWRAMGTGPKSCLIGGRVLYSEAELNRWIEAEMAADSAYTEAGA